MSSSCSYCGAPDYGTHFCLVCQRPLVRAPEAGSEPPPQGPTEPTLLKAAGFFRRLGAFALDWIVLSIAGNLLYLAYRMGGNVGSEGISVSAPSVLSTILFVLYFTLLTGDGGGQTLGKMLVGIKVQKVDGTPVLFGTALVRTLGYFVSFFFMTFLGFLWILWDKKKQGWHDKIAGTIVIQV